MTETPDSPHTEYSRPTGDPLPTLVVDHIKVGYGDLTAVWDVSLTAYPGRVTAIVGRNGAGKTTTLAGIAGLLPSTSGTVVIGGKDVTSRPTHERVAAGLGMVQEGKRIFRTMTVAENLQLGLPSGKRRGTAAAEILDGLYARFPVLADRRGANAGTLSGGQQQMLAIATALAAQPTLLMIDEPSSGLAPVIVDEILDIISGLTKEGIAVVLVEQLIEEMLSGVADDVVLVDQGRVLIADAAVNLTVEQITQRIFA